MQEEGEKGGERREQKGKMGMPKEWSSEVIEVDDSAAAMDIFWERGWTDGLPIVVPTESRVADFLDYAGLQPDEVVCRIADRNRVITAEKVAINGVMAGCLPAYMPVLVAIAESAKPAASRTLRALMLR